MCVHRNNNNAYIAKKVLINGLHIIFIKFTNIFSYLNASIIFECVDRTILKSLNMKGSFERKTIIERHRGYYIFVNTK